MTKKFRSPINTGCGRSVGLFDRVNICLAAAGLMLSSLAVQAAPQQLLWDATGGNGGNDGSGNWYDANVWWSVAGGTNYTWTGTGDQEYVTFGSSVPGNYVITNNASVTQPYSVTFTNAGTYTIVTDGTDAGQMQTIISGGGAGALVAGFYVATNVTANIDVPWRQVGSSDIFVGSNSVLTFGQGTFGNLGQIFFKGSGPASSTINATNGTWGGPNNPPGTTTADGVTFNVSGTAIVNFGSRFDLGRSASPAAGFPIANAVVNVGGPGANSQLNVNTSAGNNTGNHLQISRGGPGVLNVLSGGLLSTLSYISSGSIVSGNMRITPDSSSQGAVNISGGTVNLGTGPGGSPGVSSSALTSITLFDAVAPSATASATLNISGGVVSAKSIAIGNGGTWAANPTNQVTISGGTVYLDAPNITRLNYTGTNYAFNLSGGTIAATANWSPACSVPINLTNVNGNVTLQAADASGNPFNMAFSGALTGVGGLDKTGGGTLALNGTNTYSGATVVDNGTLSVSTLYAPVNGPVTLDGTAGTPEVSVQVANVGQTWSIGDLTYAAGSPTADFNYGSFSPSPTVAPIQVNGNLSFAVTPPITIEGSAIPAGTYPLISYSGAVSGTAPTTANITLTGGTISGYITNITARQIIALVVTSSTYSPALSWGVGDGNWDFTTPNWSQGGSAADYADGDAVLLDDSATGTSPIAITLNTVVKPGAVTFNNSAKNYSVSGSGSIAGGVAVTKDGTGALTLAGANTYTGGTILNAGQLNLNNGGDGGADSAIGTGPLTIKQGAAIDNTSGQAVVLRTPIQQNWNDDFTFAGSSNLDMGVGPVTLGNAVVTLNVNSNLFEEDGVISDNGLGYGIAKIGNGTLVLSNDNSFSGGLTLSSGTLDLNVNGADGTGLFTITGGTLDNTSGNTVTLTSSGISWKNPFTFNGSSSLDMGSAPITIGAVVMTINTNTLYTEGPLNGANTSVTMNGPGSWTIGGSGMNSGAFSLTINSGTVNCDRSFLYDSLDGQVTINTNGLLFMEAPVGTQMGLDSGMVLSGGTVEMNGDFGEIFQSIVFNSGVFQNSSGAASFQLSSTLSLIGTNCDFELTNNATLEVDAIISNSGSLLETGNGILTLTSNNVYTGSTIIEGGTLALTDPQQIGAGSISNTALIKVYSGATVDVTGRGDQTLTLNSGQSLTGKGSLNGSLTASAGSTVAPGGDITAGTFTVANNVILNGTLLLNLNNTNTPSSSQIVSTSGTITYGGVLAVTNTGPALQVGQTFQLFPSAVTAFAGISLPTTDATGNTYTWNNNVAQNGSIQVASVTPPSTINPNPGTIQFSLSGNTLSLSWPTNAGWLLQMQTNSLTTGLSTNWVTVPGSASVTSTNITINPGIGSVFYRMAHP